MKARLLLNQRHQLRADAFVELRIGVRRNRSAARSIGSDHALAMSSGVNRVLRYDNEAERAFTGSRRGRDGVPDSPRRISCSPNFWRRRRSMEAGMTSVTLSIASREMVSRRAAAAFRGEEQGAHISFDSVDLALEHPDQKAMANL